MKLGTLGEVLHQYNIRALVDYSVCVNLYQHQPRRHLCLLEGEPRHHQGDRPLCMHGGLPPRVQEGA
jgi:hypothetical protein